MLSQYCTEIALNDRTLLELSKANQHYVDILEKTNQQLSLWFNPYAVMIGVLAVLITVIGFGVAYAIYRHGQDYQKKVDDDRKQYRDMMESIRLQAEAELRNRKDFAKKADDEYSDLVKKLNEKLVAATTEQRVQLEKEIEKLRQDRAALNASFSAPLTFSGVGDSVVTSFSGSPYRQVCKTCHYEWVPYIYGIALGRDGKTCPKCGSKNIQGQM